MAPYGESCAGIHPNRIVKSIGKIERRVVADYQVGITVSSDRHSEKTASYYIPSVSKALPAEYFIFLLYMIVSGCIHIVNRRCRLYALDGIQGEFHLLTVGYA